MGVTPAGLVRPGSETDLIVSTKRCMCLPLIPLNF